MQKIFESKYFACEYLCQIKKIPISIESGQDVRSKNVTTKIKEDG